MSQQYPPENNGQQWNNFQQPFYSPPPQGYPLQSGYLPYQQQPGQFTVPPPKLLPHQRFQRLPRRTKFGVGCGTLVLILALCVCSAAASSAGSHSSTTASVRATIAPTATTQPTSVPTKAPTPRPTPKPTAKPTPVPTALPTQALVPTQPPAPTQAPAPTQPPAPPKGVNGNPWGYDFTPGTTISSPPADFCTYFDCIATFWNGNGYVEECNDTTYSLSGGLSGVCSHHGGGMRPLYSH